MNNTRITDNEAITSFDSPAPGEPGETGKFETRIRQITWRPDVNCFNYRRQYGETFAQSIVSPGIPSYIWKYGNGGAITTQKESEFNEPARIITVDKKRWSRQTENGQEIEPKAITDFDRPRLETDSGKVHFLVTAEQLEDFGKSIKNSIIQEVQTYLMEHKDVFKGRGILSIEKV